MIGLVTNRALGLWCRSVEKRCLYVCMHGRERERERENDHLKQSKVTRPRLRPTTRDANRYGETITILW